MKKLRSSVTAKIMLILWIKFLSYGCQRPNPKLLITSVLINSSVSSDTKPIQALYFSPVFDEENVQEQVESYVTPRISGSNPYSYPNKCTISRHNSPVSYPKHQKWAFPVWIFAPKVFKQRSRKAVLRP